jgi:hypothetical protein
MGHVLLSRGLTARPNSALVALVASGLVVFVLALAA